MTDIPKVIESGTAGTQEAASTELVLQEPESPFQPASIVDSIQGLASRNAKRMGGEVVATLLSGNFTQLSRELNDTKSELREVRSKIEDTRVQLSNSQKRVAVLEERLSANRNQKHFRNISIAGGSIILGIAVQIAQNQLSAAPFFLGAIGLIFILMGWVSPSMEKDR